MKHITLLVLGALVVLAGCGLLWSQHRSTEALFQPSESTESHP